MISWKGQTISGGVCVPQTSEDGTILKQGFGGERYSKWPHPCGRSEVLQMRFPWCQWKANASGGTVGLVPVDLSSALHSGMGCSGSP